LTKRQLPVRGYFVFEIHLEKSILYFVFSEPIKVFDKSISNIYFQKVFCILHFIRAKKYILQP